MAMKEINEVSVAVADIPDPNTTPFADMMRFIENLRNSTENAGEIVKASQPEQPTQEDFETVRICVSISKSDAQLLKKHRKETGETASGFLRRMILEHLR